MKELGWLIAAIVFILFIAILTTIPVMLFWNKLMPTWGVPTLTYWQTYGMMIILHMFSGIPKKGK